MSTLLWFTKKTSHDRGVPSGVFIKNDTLKSSQSAAKTQESSD